MPARPSGDVTFLFTDIEGSTRLWERQQAAMDDALRQHNRVLREAIEGAGGFVFKTVGDAFCAAFERALPAVQAALAAQRALAAACSPELCLKVRMALHSGRAREREDDYFGPPVNRVARLLACAHGGQVLVSGRTRALLGGRLPGGAGLGDLGVHRLKDLDEPEHVYQLTGPSLPRAFPPLRADAVDHLPLQATRFIGRRHDSACVREVLRSARLVTLTGAGGVGKTRLALHVAAQLAPAFSEGVRFVALGALEDCCPGVVAQAMSGALGLDPAARPSTPEALVAHLGGRQVLVVLDNCEHLLHECGALAEAILSQCANVVLLLTSRRPLGIAGERTWVVEPLPVPEDGEGPAAPAHALRSDAVRLFVDRAAAVDPAFKLDADNSRAVAQICRRLDGLPLALELAAARLNTLSAQQLAARLNDRLQLLTGGSHTAPPRQRTLEGALDWSHDLLGAGERRLFARLAVFQGGFSLEAVERVCGNDPGESDTTLDTLSRLVQHSLVVAERTGERPRFRLLNAVREYAQRRLATQPDHDDVHRAHAALCLALAADGATALGGPDQAAALRELEREHDNFRAALRWLLDRGPPDDALALTADLERFWRLHAHFAEALMWAQRALALPVEAPSPRVRALQARVLGLAGAMAWNLGRYDRAAQLLGQSLDLFRALNDPAGMARALSHLGNLAYSQGDYGAAGARHEQSLALRRDLADPPGIATCLNNLGNVAFNLGQDDLAWARHQQSLALRETLGDRHGMAISLNNLGNVRLRQGALAEARQLYERSLTLRREIGDRQGTAVSLHNLGLVAHSRTDLPAARALYEQALSAIAKTGDRSMLAHSLAQLASLRADEGHLQAAARLFGAVQRQLDALGAALDATEAEFMRLRLLGLRRALGEPPLAALLVEGQTLSLGEALALAGGERQPEPGEPS